MSTIRVGTSGWSYRDWGGVFYPAAARPADYLSYYATRFDTVEVDSTYYAIPSVRTVAGWFEKTPDAFRFAVKAPGVVTHEKVLVDCARERDAFLGALAPLRHKLWRVLLQFGYFNRAAFRHRDEFFGRLEEFLGSWPEHMPVAVEIRNRAWLCDDYFGLLRRHRAVAALADHAWMPLPETVLDTHDALTAPVLYVRLIGDRKGIEKVTTTWDRVVVDRSARYAALIAALTRVVPRVDAAVFINNHYAGHAPASCVAFLAAMAGS